MDRPLQAKYDKLQRHHNSVVRAMDIINANMAQVIKENTVLKNQLRNADQFVSIHKQIVIDNLQQSRESERRLVQEIKVLKEKIKFMRER